MKKLKQLKTKRMKILIKGEPKEIASLVLELQGKQSENALYDYDRGIKLTLPPKGDPSRHSGGGGG